MLTVSTSTTTAIMSGTEQTYNLTKEDVRDIQARESKVNGGAIPADSAAAGLQVRPNQLPYILTTTKLTNPLLLVRRRLRQQEQIRNHRGETIKPPPPRRPTSNLRLQLRRHPHRERRFGRSFRPIRWWFERTCGWSGSAYGSRSRWQVA